MGAVFNIGGHWGLSAPCTAEGRAGGMAAVGGRPQWEPGGITPGKFWKFYMPNRAFWGTICAIIGPQLDPLCSVKIILMLRRF